MTRNQIDYQKHLETVRSNLANEQLGLLQLEELKRSNAAQERLAYSGQAETNRANLAREAENYRYNYANNQYDLMRLAETIRSNKENENIGYINAGANVTNAAANSSQATTAGLRRADEYDLRTQQNQETTRHNQTMESISTNSSPWTSITTTLSQVIPRVADKVTTLITNAKSLSLGPVVGKTDYNTNNLTRSIKQGYISVSPTKSTTTVTTKPVTTTAPKKSVATTTKKSTRNTSSVGIKITKKGVQQ